MDISQFKLLKASDNVVKLEQDWRDYTFATDDNERQFDRSFKWDFSKLPSRVDLREHTGGIENQQSYNSCVGNAICSAGEYILQKNAKFQDLSRLYVYYNARRRTANVVDPNQEVTDAGSNIHIAMAECTKLGVALESIWDYNNGVNSKPSDAAFNDGKSRKVLRYERMGKLGNTSGDIQMALANGMPVIFGIALTSKFYEITGPLENHTKIYNHTRFIGPPNKDFIGNHAMLIVGYDYC